jgi:hypothetical protein
VVTHRPHDVVVRGETRFTFVTEGIKYAIEQVIESRHATHQRYRILK